MKKQSFRVIIRIMNPEAEPREEELTDDEVRSILDKTALPYEEDFSPPFIEKTKEKFFYNRKNKSEEEIRKELEDYLEKGKAIKGLRPIIKDCKGLLEHKKLKEMAEDVLENREKKSVDELKEELKREILDTLMEELGVIGWYKGQMKRLGRELKEFYSKITIEEGETKGSLEKKMENKLKEILKEELEARFGKRVGHYIKHDLKKEGEEVEKLKEETMKHLAENTGAAFLENKKKEIDREDYIELELMKKCINYLERK